MVGSDDLTFTRRERVFIRQEFADRFWSVPSILDGFWIGRWTTGPNRGQLRIPAAVQSMADRGLAHIVEHETEQPKARFTKAGLRALVAMAGEPRAFQPPERYSNLLAEIEALRGEQSEG